MVNRYYYLCIKHLFLLIHNFIPLLTKYEIRSHFRSNQLYFTVQYDNCIIIKFIWLYGVIFYAIVNSVC